MAVSGLSAASRLCERSGWALTNLKLQKLLYIAHMLHLGREGTPLVSGHFEAWNYGPVEPRVYRRVSVFGADPIGNIFHDVAAPSARSTEIEALDDTLDRFGNTPGSKLVTMTHWKRGAWSRYYRPGRRGIIIPNEAIAEEYNARIGIAQPRTAGKQPAL